MTHAVILNTLLVAAVVLIHYELLRWFSLLMPTVHLRHRVRIIGGVLVALFAHAIEIWCFAFAYYFMHSSDDWGQLAGNFDGSLLDCVYFSFATYTTLGYGDIEPLGNLRFTTGIEALTGLVMITWTASFLFFEMQRHWTGR